MIGFLGLLGNPMLLLIAVFVWIGAAQEAGAVQVALALDGVPVESAMQTSFQTLSSGDTLERASERLLGGAQQEFSVLWGSEVVGMLGRSDLMPALSQRGPQARVADVMRRDFEAAQAKEPLDSALARLSQGECCTMPVLREGKLVGLLTMENVREFVVIHGALRARQHGQAQVSTQASAPVEPG